MEFMNKFKDTLSVCELLNCINLVVIHTYIWACMLNELCECMLSNISLHNMLTIEMMELLLMHNYKIIS